MAGLLRMKPIRVQSVNIGLVSTTIKCPDTGLEVWSDDCNSFRIVLRTLSATRRLPYARH